MNYRFSATKTGLVKSYFYYVIADVVLSGTIVLENIAHEFFFSLQNLKQICVKHPSSTNLRPTSLAFLTFHILRSQNLFTLFLLKVS